jgi:MFS family permease
LYADVLITALSDLFGRKNIGMAAFVLIMVGNVVCATAQSMNTFIIGSVFMGIGAGLGEMIALAVAGEIAPTKNRGIYIGGMIMTILPFCPAVLYAQLVTDASTWRWVGVIIGGWSFVGLVLTSAFYWPPPRQIGFTRSELLQRIDYVGAFLSAAGVTLFLVGLTLPSQGQNYTWSSVAVIINVVVGVCCVVVFAIWEWRFAKYPMFPARLKEKNARVLTILLIVTFVSGANFFAVCCGRSGPKTDVEWRTSNVLQTAADDCTFLSGPDLLAHSIPDCLCSQ